MDKQIEIKRGEGAMVDLLNQEMNELQAHQKQIEEMARRLPTIEEIEKEYKEWAVDLLKVRFDLKPEAFDEHHKNNYSFENCADCLWNKIKGSIEELLLLRENQLPENAVVLTREEYEQIYGTVKSYGELLKDLQEAKSVFEKEMEEAQKEFVKQFEEHEKEVRKETAEKFAERLKAEYDAIGEKLLQSYDEVFGSDLPEWSVPDVVNSYGYIDKIDEICKEITDKGVQNGN